MRNICFIYYNNKCRAKKDAYLYTLLYIIVNTSHFNQIRLFLILIKGENKY